MRDLLLVRHGTTDWVDQQILHGITDIPLNKKGEAQAEETAQALKNSGAQKIYTSSLTRCVQTAQAIGKEIGFKPILMDSLVEINFGWLEGKHYRDHDKGEYGKLVEFYDERIHHLIRMLSGEPKRNLKKRVLIGWNSILADNPKGTVIVVAHSGVFSSILFHYFGKTFLNGDSYYHLNPCSITEIHINDSGQADLIRLSDHSHLSEENL
ncbi:MAG: histidine phosphatase family protein [Pelolinea sp.]|nr:histidine phosphatase family protein [Pelolinea sp.]